MIISLCQFGFIGTNFNAIAMEPLGHVAGTASAVLGSMQTIIGGVVGAAIGYAYDGTVLPLALGFFALALANILVVAVAERGRFFGGRQD
jgi:DHA1 family bicyclomycin/chloramphenicol resistance-like MFS transporter